MPVSLAEFNSRRTPYTTQFFATPGATRTVMICSHIWWTEQMALALLNLGYNVLVYEPLYLLYTEEAAFDTFDTLWAQAIAVIRRMKVEVMIGGNAAALAPHPGTGELLHNAAGVPLVNYWWDEPRSEPPFAGRGIGPEAYLGALRDERTLNVVWDVDVLEELGAFCGVRNTVHVPLACLPEFWPSGFVAVEQRPLAACFLGNCHFACAWCETDVDPLVAWARAAIDRKQAAQDRPLAECIAAAGAIPEQTRHLRADAARPEWRRFVLPWEILNSVWMHRTRNLLVQAAERHLHGKLALIGKGWNQLGLRANSEHAGEKSGMVYAQSRASLNLFGGCVHGGMPLRPFDITASGGLLVTHYQRELPGLFEIGRECVAFRNQGEMIEALDRIQRDPASYTEMALAGRRRTLADHTWSRRMAAVMAAARERFG
ncbi:MAG TPA: glycosyltransferase [Phycisphaerae bacterium]|nr:glycosyltransferase [Phycisphaerae bacterium]